MYRKFCWNKKEEGRQRQEERDRGAEGGRKEKEELSTAISMVHYDISRVYISFPLLG